MIATLLPRSVTVAEATPEERAAPPPLLAAELPFVARAVESRAREFALGRACARRALAALGRDAVPLLPLDDRRPDWPAGTVGSITHCAGYCAAAVGSATDLDGLGIDAEPAGSLRDDLVGSICTDDELRRLRDLADLGSTRELAQLVFGAKECVFKAVYPVTGVFLEFEDVRIELDRDLRHFLARPARAVIDLAGHDVLRGGLARSPDHVFAALALERG